METKDTKRAVRREHVARLKKNRAGFWGAKWSGGMTPKQLGMVVHTPHLCSCYMCGNPRKYRLWTFDNAGKSGRTLKELADLRFERSEQLGSHYEQAGETG